MFTIKVAGHTRSFEKFSTKDQAEEALTSLGWTPSAIPDAYYKNHLTALLVPYYEPLPLEALRTLKIPVS